MVFIHIFLRQNSLDEKNTHRLLYGMTEPIKLRVRLKSTARVSAAPPLEKRVVCFEFELSNCGRCRTAPHSQ